MSKLEREEVVLKAKEIIAGVLEQDENVEKINDDTNLLIDYGFDSIMLVEFVSEIEESFDIMFSDEDVYGNLNLGQTGHRKLGHF